MADATLSGPAAKAFFSSSSRFPLPHASLSSILITNVRSKSNIPMAAASLPSSSSASPSSSIHNPNPSPNSTQPSLLVFSGGTAFNGVVEELKKVTTRVAHVLPVSDDGGSTAEIVRVLGGPAVGDIRSRCLRLSDESTSEALAVRRLLGHRLPLDASVAKSMWYEIVEGAHPLWTGVSEPYRETIRAFLAYFQNQILRRSNGSFCFSNGSIEIPRESLVLPVISTNDRLTLGCELWDGTIIRGQNEISHPTNGRMGLINKDCTYATRLPCGIKRVFYMSSEGSNLFHEVFPVVNPTVLEQLSKVDCIVYGMGSLFTSICPSLVLHGIGELIASRPIPKVLLLNGSHDRETSSLSASGFVTAITDALNRAHGNSNRRLNNHVTVDSIKDPKVGIIFDPRSLIGALTSLILDIRNSCLMDSSASIIDSEHSD